jgi:hypothetical protein
VALLFHCNPQVIGWIVSCLPAVVQCRIEVRHENLRSVVHVIGRLTEAQVPALLEACGALGDPVIVELGELISADAVGVEGLRRLQEQGARLRRLPEYLRFELDADPDPDGPTQTR